MNILEKNLEMISIYSEDLVEKIKNCKDACDTCEVYRNFNDELVVKCQDTNGNLIHYTSYYNPIEQADDIVKNVEFDTNRLLVVCVGIGAAYQVDKVLEKKTERSMVIVVEKDLSLLKEILSIKDYSNDILKNGLYFCTEDKLEDQISVIMANNNFSVSKISYVTFEVFDLNYLRFVKNVIDIIEKYKEKFLFALGNDIDDTILGVRNNFDNLVQYIKSPGIEDILNKFNNAYENKPAIIVASGPSLDKNIGYLKSVQNKALILSCDGSYSTLLKNGIVPHTIGSVERIEETYRAFYKGKEFDERVVLTAPAVVKKKIVDKFIDPNRVLGMFKNEAYGEWFNKLALNKGTVICGASVAHLMCGVAMKLKCNPIILIGQDLAYSKDGVSHTSEAEVKEQKDLSEVEVYVEGINGEKLPSTYIWKRFLDIYEDIIKNNNKYNFIDATEGGALIEGTEIMSLKDAINKYCSEEIVPLIDLVNKANIPQERIKEILINSKKEVEKEIDITKELIKRSKKAIKENKKSKEAIKKGIKSDKSLTKIYDCIDYVEFQIVNYIASSGTLMMLFQYPIILASHEINLVSTDKFTFESIEANIDIHKKLLTTVEKFSEKALKEYEIGLEKIEKELETLTIE